MSARGSCYGVRSARGPNCSAIISGVLKGFLQLLNPYRALGENLAYSHELFNLFIEKVRTLGSNYLKLARALARRLDAFARRLELCFQLRHLMFQFFNPLGPFSRGIAVLGFQFCGTTTEGQLH